MSFVEIDRRGPLCWLTLSRPEKSNSLHHEMVLELLAALDELRRDPEVRVLLLTGAGETAFSAGADLHLMSTLEERRLRRFLADTRRLFRTLAEMPQPTIAVVNGHAHGAGAELACACDLRLGCERTTFRFPGVTYGLAVGTWHLPTVVGLPAAKELLLTGKRVEAEECCRLGLLNHCPDSARLLDEATTLATEIAGNPRAAVFSVKALLNRTVGAPLQQRFYRELYSNQDRGASLEIQERMRRSLEPAAADDP